MYWLTKSEWTHYGFTIMLGTGRLESNCFAIVILSLFSTMKIDNDQASIRILLLSEKILSGMKVFVALIPYC